MGNLQQYLVSALLCHQVAVVGAQTPPGSFEHAGYGEPFRSVVNHDNSAQSEYLATDDNDQLPNPQDHVDAFLYLLSDDCDDNGLVFAPA